MISNNNNFQFNYASYIASFIKTLSIFILSGFIFIISSRVFYNEDGMILKYLRSTEQKNKSNINENNKEIEKYWKEYEFINNISYIKFGGEWSNLYFPNQEYSFRDKKGEAKIEFTRANNSNNENENRKENNFLVSILIKEGEYIDRYIRTNLTVSFPQLFLENIISGSELKFQNENIEIEFTLFIFLQKQFVYSKNNTNFTLTFFPKEKIIIHGFEGAFISKYSKLNLSIVSPEFGVNIEAEMEFSKDLPKKIRNYSFILSIIAISEIFVTLILLIEIRDNSQLGINLDLFTIIISLIFKSYICSVNFFLSITTNEEGISSEYGITSIIYFFSFSGFELRLLFFAWRARYQELFFTNPNQFKRKLILFYFYFYSILFFNLIFIRKIISNTYFCFALFTGTWIFQIIYSVKNSTKPPMSKKYILISTIGRLYLPIYLKGYSENSFELRPNYLKVFFIILIVVLESIILCIQKDYGAKSILPKCMKTLPYNYYRDSININEHIAKNPDCAICLEDLNESIENNNMLFLNSSENNIILKNSQNLRSEKTNQFMNYLKNLKIILMCKNCLNTIFGSQSKRKKYMITPCDHIYHAKCLEQWMEIKNVCPYCKAIIPPIE